MTQTPGVAPATSWEASPRSELCFDAAALWAVRRSAIQPSASTDAENNRQSHRLCLFLAAAAAATPMPPTGNNWTMPGRSRVASPPRWWKSSWSRLNPSQPPAWCRRFDVGIKLWSWFPSERSATRPWSSFQPPARDPLQGFYVGWAQQRSHLSRWQLTKRTRREPGDLAAVVLSSSWIFWKILLSKSHLFEGKST